MSLCNMSAFPTCVGSNQRDSMKRARQEDTSHCRKRGDLRGPRKGGAQAEGEGCNCYHYRTRISKVWGCTITKGNGS